MSKSFCFLSLLTLAWLACSTSASTGSEFQLGTFIVTQEALSEAPQRYVSFLDKLAERLTKVRLPPQIDYGCVSEHLVYPTGPTMLIYSRGFLMTGTLGFLLLNLTESSLA